MISEPVVITGRSARRYTTSVVRVETCPASRAISSMLPPRWLITLASRIRGSGRTRTWLLIGGNPINGDARDLLFQPRGNNPVGCPGWVVPTISGSRVPGRPPGERGGLPTTIDDTELRSICRRVVLAMRTASLLNPVLSHKRDTPGRSRCGLRL